MSFFSVSVDSDGTFRIEVVPAGDWILTGGVSGGSNGAGLAIAPIKVTITSDDQGEKNFVELKMKMNTRRYWSFTQPLKTVLKPQPVHQ